MSVWSCHPVAEHYLLGLLHSLKVVASGGAGLDHLDVPFITSRGLRVTNAPGHQLAGDPKTTHIPQSLMGEIGYKIAQRSKGFDRMMILYHNGPEVVVVDEQAAGATFCESLDDLLRRSDFVVLAVNLTPNATGPSGHTEPSLTRPTATLVTISRGLVMDRGALVGALQSGTIDAAALDVTYPEPLPRSLPIIALL
ncbi:probable 2-ketogluconate reductase [Xiphias gladius]|uniref:probable 2-ketogluconate reductase n=1 Tax=Xiphias gladius TaxID=8245 RepID=UPI001A986861|nr:probable 2-ketogluconate reductase [Xiphias gladius]